MQNFRYSIKYIKIYENLTNWLLTARYPAPLTITHKCGYRFGSRAILNQCIFFFLLIDAIIAASLRINRASHVTDIVESGFFNFTATD